MQRKILAICIEGQNRKNGSPQHYLRFHPPTDSTDPSMGHFDHPLPDESLDKYTTDCILFP